MKKTALTLSIMALVAWLNVMPARAATGDFTIYPTYKHGNNSSWLILNMEEGEHFTDSVTIENLTNQEQNLKLEIHDATEENGTFVLQEDKNQKKLGGWMSIETDNITLKPHEKRKIPVAFNIPKNVPNQEYTASILASKTEKNAQNILITTRIGVRVYTNITAPQSLQANIFNSSQYNETAFFLFSFMGVLGAIFYNIIHYQESKKYAKKQA